MTAGCGKTDKDGVIVKELSAKEAVSHLEQVYRTAEEATQQQVKAVIAAEKAQDHERAVMGVMVLQSASAQASFDQAQALQAMMSSLQRQIVEGVDRNDPKAIRAAQLLKASASGNR